MFNFYTVVKLCEGEKLHGYTVQKVTPVPDFDVVAVQLIHEQTKAQHLHLARDDTNNTFGYEIFVHC